MTKYLHLSSYIRKLFLKYCIMPHHIRCASINDPPRNLPFVCLDSVL
jgi:hypothetical protein